MEGETVGVEERGAAEAVAAGLYEALACGDRERIGAVLHESFEGRTTEGLPFGLGGVYSGPDAMRREFWGRIAKHYAARAVPAEYRWLDDGRLAVIGRYTGKALVGGGALDADFVHLLSFAEGRISALVQLTDSQRWTDALAPSDRAAPPVDFTVEDNMGIVRLNRPERRNAIDQAVANALLTIAQNCASRADLRALVFLGNGPAFTVGGDIAVFADTASEELGALLRSMATPFHEALRIFAELPLPIVAGVHGSVGGGGLGLVYCADHAIAAEGTKFASGFAAIGLSGDGGTSWYLPRLVGVRRAQQIYAGRVLDAVEAQDWGLISEVVAPAVLERTALAHGRKLAAGPTRAFAEIRALLRKSASSSLSDQLRAEVDALARTGATADAAAAVRSFVGKSAPTFEGR